MSARRARVALAGLWALAATLGSGAALAGGAVQPGVMWPGIYPGHPFIAPMPHRAGCGLYTHCVPPWWDARRDRARPTAPPPPAVEPDIWGGSGSPWGYVRRVPPPTPESQIQPQYRDASTIRPEFLDR